MLITVLAVVGSGVFADINRNLQMLEAVPVRLALRLQMANYTATQWTVCPADEIQALVQLEVKCREFRESLSKIQTKGC